MQRIVTRSPIHLFYHAFTGTPIPHIEPLFACKSPGDLERDLVYLKSHFRIVSHDEVVSHRDKGWALPPNAAALSFDDGFVECFTVARPLLLAHAIPATFFVCKSFIDNQGLMFRNKIALCIARIADATPIDLARFTAALSACFRLPRHSPREVQAWLLHLGFGDSDAIDVACRCLGVDVQAFLRDRQPYMTRDQIAQLQADGFTIGAHTSDHPELSKLADWNEVRRQVSESCDVVREITGRTRVPFAFPFNGLGLPRAALVALRHELDIDLMYDTTKLLNDEIFIVNRICCDAPKGANSRRSNLPRLIWRARMIEVLRALRCLLMKH